MTHDLTGDEKLALVAHLGHALEYDPYPYALRLDPLKAILAKLEPPSLSQNHATAAAGGWGRAMGRGDAGINGEPPLTSDERQARRRPVVRVSRWHCSSLWRRSLEPEPFRPNY
jgi:hypothetical protein